MSGSSSLTISSRTGQYGVTVAAGGFTQLLIDDADALLIVDQRFESLVELEDAGCSPSLRTNSTRR